MQTLHLKFTKIVEPPESPNNGQGNEDENDARFYAVDYGWLDRAGSWRSAQASVLHAIAGRGDKNRRSSGHQFTLNSSLSDLTT